MPSWSGVILAAGSGTRLLDSGIATPKPLAPVTNTMTLLDLCCEALLQAGVATIFCITNSQFIAEIKAHIHKSPYQTTRLLERNTRSAFHTLSTIEQIHDTDRFVVLNVDSTIDGADILNAIGLFEAGSTNIVYGYTDLDVTDDNPLYIDVDLTTSRVLGLGAESKMREFMTSGMYLFSSAIFPWFDVAKRQSIITLREFLGFVLHRRTVLASYVPNSVDVDTADDLLTAQRKYSEQHKQK